MPAREYRRVILAAAQKDIRALPPKIQGQISRTIDRLMERYREGERPQDIRAIEGRPNSYGIDSGEYRILYEVKEDEALIRVFRIGHRKDVYRNL